MSLRASETVLAKLFAVDRRTVTRWLGEGLPAAAKIGRTRQIDVAGAIAWVRDRDRRAADERLAAAQARPDLELARARKVSAEATIAELNAREREGELLAAADVQTRWSRRVLAARERLLSLASAAVQSGLVGVDREQDLRRLVHEALEELADA